MKHKKKKAFTLVELLVVIAVIAILFIVIISKVNFTTDKAKDAGVLTDFRSYQIGLQQAMRENPNFENLELLDLKDGLNNNIDKKLKFSEYVNEDTGETEQRSDTYNPYGYKYVLDKDSEGIKVYSISDQGGNEILKISNNKVYADTNCSVGKLLLLGYDKEFKVDDFGKEDLLLGQTGGIGQQAPDKDSDPQPIQAEVPEGWVGIYTVDDLNNIRNGLAGKYILMSNLDLNVAPYNTGTGWEPIGGRHVPFTGKLDGNGLTVSNLYSNNPNMDRVGLFRYLSDGATINNLGLKNIDITGKYYVGGLAGSTGQCSITECYVTGSIEGILGCGGIVGSSSTGSNIERTFADISINKNQNTEALVQYIGGLVGSSNGTLSNCYANGSVVGKSSTGGLVGTYQGRITNSYSTVNVKESNGGYAGGLVGHDNKGGSPIYWSYWDTDKSEADNYTGGGYLDGNSTVYGKTTAEMMQKQTYIGWDFVNIWKIEECSGYPKLMWEK